MSRLAGIPPVIRGRVFPDGGSLNFLLTLAAGPRKIPDKEKRRGGRCSAFPPIFALDRGAALFSCPFRRSAELVLSRAFIEGCREEIHFGRRPAESGVPARYAF